MSRNNKYIEKFKISPHRKRISARDIIDEVCLGYIWAETYIR